ncbi:ST4A1 Sulfotransferase, partial [Atractosteus spatula]|nr:ST4A1 Sulfotransferase [Atractosteus spatula]
MAESEAETPSTPIEFESKYFEYNGVRLPPFCRGKMEEIANFSLRNSDIWIVTYPKSDNDEACSTHDIHQQKPTVCVLKPVAESVIVGAQERLLAGKAVWPCSGLGTEPAVSSLFGGSGKHEISGGLDPVVNRAQLLAVIAREHRGTSLLQEVVYLVSQGVDPDEIGLMNIDEQLPVLEYPQPGLDIIQELTSPRLIKSHLPYRFLPTAMHNGESKVIYMARNPKDLVVSYYQFHRSLRTMSYRGTFQEFCRRFMNDKLGYGSWFEHVQEFWEHRMDSNVLFLKYEDMYKDLATLVEQLARFLGVSCDKAQLESMVESCHQLIEQCCNPETLSICRGRVGLWKDIFTVSMNEKFDAVYKQKMGKSDLTFDFSL